MKLIYKSKYNIIEENMSDNNIGSRKKPSSIDHIFMINSIIHEEPLTKKNNPLQIQICNFQQMFDGINLHEALSDLFHSGVYDDYLPLIYEANKNLQINIKTPLTVQQTLEVNVLQGDTLSSIIASKQVDTIGKRLLKENPDFLLSTKTKFHWSLANG